MKLKLLEPFKGYEDVAEYKRLQVGDHYIADNYVFNATSSGALGLVLTPKVKKYDWDKTSEKALIVMEGGTTSCINGDMSYPGKKTLSTEWIPHFGGECPFDEDAVIVQVRYRNGNRRIYAASGFSWVHPEIQDDIIATRFVKLVEGYEW